MREDGRDGTGRDGTGRDGTGQTDGRIGMTKPVLAFRNFANAPKNCSRYCAVIFVSALCGNTCRNSNPVGDEIFSPSRPALGPSQPPVKWVPCLSRG